VPAANAGAGVPRRSREQRLHALQRANEVRSARAKLKKELAAGTIELAQILADPPASVRTARVRDVLVVLPKIGSVKAGPHPRPVRHRSREDARRSRRSAARRVDQAFPALTAGGARLRPAGSRSACKAEFPAMRTELTGHRQACHAVLSLERCHSRTSSPTISRDVQGPRPCVEQAEVAAGVVGAASPQAR
jgi:hypothetical protein